MIRLTQLALRYPPIAIVLTLALLVGGTWAALNLNQQLIPDVAFPQATVVVVWPGASADEVTRGIVEPLETALEGISDVEVVEVSARASESFAALTVRAEYGTDQDELRDAIKTEVDDVALPSGAEEPDIVLFSFGDLPVVQASIRAEDDDLDPASLQRLIEDEIVPEIEAVDGVSKVTLVGGREEKVYLTLDRAKMADAGVTVDTIRNVLAANDISFPAGTLTTDGRSIPLQVSHRVRSEEGLRALALGGGGPGGAPGPVAGGPPAGSASAGQPASGAGSAQPTRVAAGRPAPLPTVVGPFPLPAALQALGYATTDDLTADAILELEAQNPELLRTVADEVIASLPPGAVLPPDVIAALPNDVRARLAARIAAPPTVPAGLPEAPPAAAETAPAPTDTATGSAQPARVRVVVVAEGDTLEGLAVRHGVTSEAIRAANGLVGDSLLIGSVLRIPEPDTGDQLPATWQPYGATTPAEVTPEILDLVLRDAPDLVSNLTAEQLLALPPEAVRQLPLPFVSRQPDDVRQAILDRMSQIATPAPAPTPGGAASAAGAGGPRLLAPARQSSAEGLTLGDVATITREPEPARTINRSDGQPSLSLLVLKEQSANTVTVVEAVLDAIDEIQDRPELDGVAFNIVFEQATFIEESLSGVRNEGLLGGILAVIVILLFLNFSVRATLVTAVSIPLSIVVALLLMRVQGLSLNLLSLAGLTIAIGRVIDDSIVVIENIYRHVHRGEEGDEAVIEGTREVATAITAATLVTVAVFLPLGFVGGITSEIFLPFALTASYALLASLLVALTIVPLLARWLLSRAAMPDHDENWLQRWYTPVLTWALDHRLATLLLAFVFFGVSLALVRFVDRTFLPGFGEPTIAVEMALAPGTGLATTDAVARRVEAVLADEGDLGAVEASVGRGGQSFEQFFGGGSGGDSARAYFQVKVEDDDGSDGDDEDGALSGLFDSGPDPDEVADRLRDALETVPAAAAADGVIGAGEAITFTVSAGTGGGPQGNLYDLQVRSDDEAALREANDRILAALGDASNWEDLGYDEIPIINLSSNLTEARDILSVDVDPAKAVDRGLSTIQVAFALRQALEGQAVGDVEITEADGSQTLEVVARYPADTLDSMQALEDFEISGPKGPVRVGDVAAVRVEPGPVQITRVSGQRAALINGEITTNDTFGVIEDATAIIDDLDLADDFGEDVIEIGAGVESRQQQEGFRDMLLALPVSILVVYLIMVVTFGSLIHPFTILFSLPFAVSGALVALAITGRPLSLSSLIGVMMLIGIVTTNAIVLVDLVQQYRERGVGAREALIAGGRNRVRPIMMTAIATVIALIPLSLGLTEGALIASELATTVIGGLTTSTLLTLIVVPVIYRIIDGLGSGGAEPTPSPSPGGPGGGMPAPGAAAPDPAVVVAAPVVTTPVVAAPLVAAPAALAPVAVAAPVIVAPPPPGGAAPASPAPAMGSEPERGTGPHGVAPNTVEIGGDAGGAGHGGDVAPTRANVDDPAGEPDAPPPAG